MSLDLTEEVPALRPEVDDDERDTEDFEEVDDDERDTEDFPEVDDVCREEDEDLAFPRD